MKIPSLENWGRLWDTDLTLNSIERAETSQYPQDQCLQEFQQYLGRKRYVDDDTGHVRAVLRSCRPNFHFFQIISVILRLCPTRPATSGLSFDSYFASADQAATDKPELDRVRTEESSTILLSSARRSETKTTTGGGIKNPKYLLFSSSSWRRFDRFETPSMVCQYINVSRLRPTNPM